MIACHSRLLRSVLVVCLPVLIFAGQEQVTEFPSSTPSAGTTLVPSALNNTASPSTAPIEVTSSPTGPEPSSIPTSIPSSTPSTSPPTAAPTSRPTLPPLDPPTTGPSPANVETGAPAPTWGGCVDPNVANAGAITIGDPTTVCLTVGPGGDWATGANYLRWVFQPEADQYSRFHIPNSFNDFVRNAGSSPFGDRNLTVHTASQDFLSFLRVYYDPRERRVFPYLTAIIDVDDGVVTGIAWDNACVFCSGGRCVENTYNFAGVNAVDLDIDAQTKGCYLSVDECAAVLIDAETGSSPTGGYEASEGNTCDLTLYVVWTGTDSKGGAFQSSNYRFGAFPEARLQDRVRNNLPDFPDFNPF